jgi:hypothetical protein
MKLFRLLSLSAALLFSTGAYALTCDDIEFTGSIEDTFPNVEDYCLEVVEREGVQYARIHARIATPGFSTVVIQAQHPDGSWGERRKITPASDFRVRIAGRDTRIRDLVRGQEINIYLKEGDWNLAMTDEAAETVEIAAIAPYVAPVTIEEHVEDDTSTASMPKTATMVPFIGMLGGLMIAFGLVLRLRRR